MAIHALLSGMYTQNIFTAARAGNLDMDRMLSTPPSLPRWKLFNV